MEKKKNKLGLSLPGGIPVSLDRNLPNSEIVLSVLLFRPVRAGRAFFPVRDKSRGRLHRRKTIIIFNESGQEIIPKEKMEEKEEIFLHHYTIFKLVVYKKSCRETIFNCADDGDWKLVKGGGRSWMV
jgi:hypothetical protein